MSADENDTNNKPPENPAETPIHGEPAIEPSPEIEIGTHPSGEVPPSTLSKDWREKIRDAFTGFRDRLAGFRQRGAGRGDLATTSKFEQWHIRDRLAKMLPADLAKSLPRNFEPIALAEWAGQAFQKDAVAFYGKGLTILVCAYFLADITSLLVEKYIPDPPVPRAVRQSGGPRAERTADAYEVIATRNIFDSTNKAPGEEGPAPSEDQGPPQKTTLPFNLIGTLILRDELKSIATIEDKSASTVYPVRQEDEIPSKARIIKIEPRRVIFVNTASGRREFVELPEDPFANSAKLNLKTAPKPSASKGIEQVAPNHFSLDRKFVDKTLQDLNKVLTEARAVPNFENGQPAGYKLFQIVPGSIFDTLGLKNGDTIAGLNGQPINDPGKAFELLNELKTAKNLELQIKRDGRQQNFNYDIR